MSTSRWRTYLQGTAMSARLWLFAVMITAPLAAFPAESSSDSVPARVSASTTTATSSPALTLADASELNPYDPALVLGGEAFASLSNKWSPTGSESLARHISVPGQPGFFDSIDYADVTMPGSEGSIVRFGAPGHGPRPVLAFAYQKDDLEEIRRIGLGGGIRWDIAPRVTVGADVIRFGPDAGNRPGAASGETVLMGRVEIGF